MQSGLWNKIPVELCKTVKLYASIISDRDYLNCFIIFHFRFGLSCTFVCVPNFYSFLGLVVWGCGIRNDRVPSLSPSLALLTPFNNNNLPVEHMANPHYRCDRSVYIEFNIIIWCCS